MVVENERWRGNAQQFPILFLFLSKGHNRLLNVVSIIQIFYENLIWIRVPSVASTRQVNIWATTWENNKMNVRPASSVSAWRKLGSSATHWAHSEDSDQTGRMPRLIWFFAGRTLILLVFSCSGSFVFFQTVSHAVRRRYCGPIALVILVGAYLILLFASIH